MKFPKSGYPTYGEAIGIMMQGEVGWPRIPGDVGNAFSFDFPVKYKAIKGLGRKEIVTPNPSPQVETMLVNAAKELENDGVRAIVGGVGFMIIFQNELASAVNIPVFSSSLLLLPLISRTLGKNKRIGIITANAAALTKRHLEIAGWNDSIPIAMIGLDSLPDTIENSMDKLVPEERLRTMESNINYLVNKIVSDNPDIGSLLFECTGFPPTSYEVNDLTGLPVYDVVSLVNLANEAVIKTKYPIGNKYM